MNREIKCRGKRVDGGGWICGNLIECAITGKKYIFPAGSDANESSKVYEEGCLRLVAFEVIPETVGQYAGLEDINEALIYEGDILRNGERGRKRYEVVWLDGCLYAKRKESSNTTRYHIIGNKEYIVIGNIHENPELMEVQS